MSKGAFNPAAKELRRFRSPQFPFVMKGSGMQALQESW
jgi:hypothetical protein